MKRLRNLKRSFEAPTLPFVPDEQAELQNLRRVQPSSDASAFVRKDLTEENDKATEPSDVARRLWCTAGHF
jgi:hypothetical protein